MKRRHFLIILLSWLSSSETTTAITGFRAVRVLNNYEHSSAKNVSSSRHQQQQLVQELYVTQTLDHFNAQDVRTWQQRYFYSDQYAYSDADKQQYIFLCMGGEGPALDKSVLVDSVHCSGDMLYTAAYLHNTYNKSVHLYALEHRFYGKSQPFSTNQTDDTDEVVYAHTTNDHLQYLSSEQALQDAAVFVQKIQRQLNTNHTTVITFGASYPGYLSALMRLQFPHVVYAAVSHSAPVQATLNMVSYKNQVADNFRNFRLGGSTECHRIVQQGHEQLTALVVESANHERLAHEFQLCNATSLLDQKNIQLFVGDGVIDSYDMQSNDPACTAELCNLQKICAALVQQQHAAADKEEWITLAWLVRTMRTENCIVLDWNQTISELSNPENEWRAWLWQTCTEFGYYQTCLENSDCPYGRGWHPLEQDLEICRVAFNITAVERNVQATNVRYGGYDMSVTRVLSVTGTEDPWTTLAFRPDHPPPNDQPFHSVLDASHHYWTHPPKLTDDVHVQHARQVVLQQVLEWLGLTSKVALMETRSLEQ